MNKKRWHIPLYVFSALLAIHYGSPEASLAGVADAKPRAIELQGHRGARGLFPENTWPAIKSAIEAKMNTIEVDFHLTADERFIAHHDARLHMQNCRAKEKAPVAAPRISHSSIDQLKKFDCGYGDTRRFPRLKQIQNTRLLTLSEIADRLHRYKKKTGQNIGLNIEIKISRYHQVSLEKTALLLNQVIKQKKLEQMAWVQSFHISFLKALKDVNPAIRVIAVFGGKRSAETMIRLAHWAGAGGLNVHQSLATRNLVRQARRQKMRVLAWTVNKPENMRKMLHVGVDGIISDYPDRLYNTITAWQNSRRAKSEA